MDEYDSVHTKWWVEDLGMRPVTSREPSNAIRYRVRIKEQNKDGMTGVGCCLIKIQHPSSIKKPWWTRIEKILPQTPKETFYIKKKHSPGNSTQNREETDSTQHQSTTITNDKQMGQEETKSSFFADVNCL